MRFQAESNTKKGRGFKNHRFSFDQIIARGGCRKVQGNARCREGAKVVQVQGATLHIPKTKDSRLIRLLEKVVAE